MDNIIDEHFMPDGGLDINSYLEKGDISGVHHLIRYLWAESVLSDCMDTNGVSILDVACGSGYGSYCLAKKYPKMLITGADYDANAIKGASALYSLPNLQYIVGDTTRWEETIGCNKFDYIVSFDTIEHVKHREIMMENIVKHLKVNGMLLLSTPCGQSENILDPDWEYHRIEFSAISLFDFISRYFKTILRPDDCSLPHLRVFDILNGTTVNYLLKMNPIICKNPILVNNPYVI
jgi:2-polyprenyl-3-methyl-5-hydroxy-6-metoxy-1,4-benzoquinol methylase